MEVRFCPRCGGERWPEARFCGECAYDYAELDLGLAGQASEASAPATVAPATPAQFATVEPDADAVADTIVLNTSAWLETPGQQELQIPPAEWVAAPEVRWQAEAADGPWPSPGYDETAPASGRERRLATLAFAVAGAVLLVVACGAISLGLPQESSGLPTLAHLGDPGASTVDYIAIVVALAAAVLAISAAGLFVAKAIQPIVAIIALAVGGVAAEVAGIAILGRVAYDASGSILAGAVVWIGGAAAIIAAALVGAVTRG